LVRYVRSASGLVPCDVFAVDRRDFVLVPVLLVAFVVAAAFFAGTLFAGTFFAATFFTGTFWAPACFAGTLLATRFFAGEGFVVLDCRVLLLTRTTVPSDAG
jgi:hypothetical protein